MSPRPFLVGGVERTGPSTTAVRSPFDGALVDEVAVPGAGDVEEALAAASSGFEAARALPAWRRARILRAASVALESSRERFARTIALEAGKPIALARAEVDRAVLTLRISGEEAERILGETLPLDAAPWLEGRFGITRRFPVGPVACITPFNFPLNLVAHKVGPAFAAGCSVVVKPASRTPLSALALGSLLLEAGFPGEAISILPVPGGEAAPIVRDPRIRAVSFTGSASVGWELRREASRKKVVLELGGNAGLIVDRSADLDRAAVKTASGGFGYAGQSCISVQRVLVHEDVRASFVEKLLARVAELRHGDPLDEGVTIGPMITEDDARRAEAWVREAVAGGASLLAGGGRRGAFLEPAVLTGTRPGMKVCDLEVFAPVVSVEPFRDLPDAIARVDRSDYGLQAGIFSRDLPGVLAAFEGIEVGALVVNDAPTFRADAMPYGGVKGSGAGREGPRYAIEDYTELRLLVLGA
jgi:acyl-CoA reductase-like NAD-dependent aldehyde dehydrogenase